MSRLSTCANKSTPLCLVSGSLSSSNPKWDIYHVCRRN
jgi:hypothetical protein